MATRKMLLILLAGLITGCNNRSAHNNNNATLPLASQLHTRTIDTTVELRVMPLLTVDHSQEDSFVKDFQYPVLTTATGSDSLCKKIMAFGAAYEVWTGLKGWTGRGEVGIDGSLVVNLYPPGDSSNGSHFSFEEIPSCRGCMACAAAPFFQGAKEWYYKEFRETRMALREKSPGIQINKVSPTLVTYTLPERNNMITTGVVFFVPPGDNDAYYSSAKFVLPASQKAMADFMVNNYILSRKLN